MAGDWEEEQHPRDASGKFGAGGGEKTAPVASSAALKAFADKKAQEGVKLSKQAFATTAKAEKAKGLKAQMNAHEKAADAHDQAMRHLEISVAKGHISREHATATLAEHDKAAEHHEDRFIELQKQHEAKAADKASKIPKETPKELTTPTVTSAASLKEAPKEAAPKPAIPIGARGTHTKSTIDVPHAEVDAMLKKHGPVFKSLERTMKSALAEYPSYKKKDIAHLSEKEQMLHVAGEHIGKYFEEKIGGKFHEKVSKEWKRASDTNAAQQLHGALRAMGVAGHPIPGEEMKQRDTGAQNKQMHAYVQKLAAFHRAVYKSMGIKELTLYRGVSDQAGGLKKGQSGPIRGREAASFTTDPKVAAKFGRVLKYKVPVEKVLMSSITSPEFNATHPSGEAEVVVIGSSKLKGTVL